jgi:hypothetical protein
MSKIAGIPTYRRHASGQTRVTLRDAVTGKKKDFLFGKFGSPESKSEYGRVIQQWEACGRRLQETKGGDVTGNEVVLAYRQFADQYYRRADGTLKNEITEVAQSSKPLKELYGHTLAREFGPMALKACRERMIDRDLCTHLHHSGRLLALI